MNYYQQVIRALRKCKDSDLTTPLQKELADKYCHKVEVERDLLLAKQEIVKGNYLVAAQYLTNVVIERPTMKLKLALVGLMLFPKLLARFVRRSTSDVSLQSSALAISSYSAGA